MKSKQSNIVILMSILLAIMCSTSLQAQKTDHLDLELSIQADSNLVVSVDYQIQELKSKEAYFLLFPAVENLKIMAEGLVERTMGQKSERPFPYHKLSFEEGSEGKPKNVKFSYTIDLRSSNHIKSQWIELNVDKLWLPNYDDIDNEFTYSAHVNNELEDYSFMSYTLMDGVFTPQIHQNAKEFELKCNEPTLEIFLMGGANMFNWESGKSEIPIQIFASEDTDSGDLQSFADNVASSINYYNQLFGRDKKIDSYQVIFRNTKPKEISYLQARGAILLGNSFANDFASISHEVSHYWWYGADFINEPWLNESFANYSMLALLEKYDSVNFQKQLDRMKKGAETAGSIIGTNSFADNGFQTYYYKGALILWDLEQKIGKKEMQSLLEARVTRKIHTTSEWLNLVEEFVGNDVLQWHKAQLN